jgi:hypothetical protein
MFAFNLILYTLHCVLCMISYVVLDAICVSWLMSNLTLSSRSDVKTKLKCTDIFFKCGPVSWVWNVWEQSSAENI